MPIRVDNDLPAREVLESENIFMMGEEACRYAADPSTRDSNIEFDAAKAGL